MASFAEKEFAIALSPALLEDLLRVLEKPKLGKLLSPNIFEDMISLIHMKALIVKPRVKVKACRDPEDDAVIECAIAAKAKRLVTGDQDLLTMKTYRGISIIRPAPSHQAWAFPDFPHLGAEFTFLRSHLKRWNTSRNTGSRRIFSSKPLNWRNKMLFAIDLSVNSWCFAHRQDL